MVDDAAFIAERKKTTEYFYDDKDTSEAVKVIATWDPRRIVAFIEYFLTTSFERRDMDWEAAYGLVRALAASDGPMSGAQLIEGFAPLFNNIEDVMCDLPKAGEHIAACVAGPVLDGSCALADVVGASHHDERLLAEAHLLPHCGRRAESWQRCTRCGVAQAAVAVARRSRWSRVGNLTHRTSGRTRPAWRRRCRRPSR